MSEKQYYNMKIECFGRRGKQLGEAHYPTNKAVATDFLERQFTRAPDGYVTINGRFGFTLSQALSHLSSRQRS